MKASFLLPASLASLVLAHSPSIYILMPSTPALTAVSSALNTLGYTYSESTASSNSAELGLDPSTYAVLASGTAYKNISRANPEARFILLAASDSSANSNSWLGTFFREEEEEEEEDVKKYDADSVRAFFADMGSESGRNGASQLLELDVFATSSHAQAQTWVALCDFLGLGYSVVERLKLWHFP
ncbi:hypothetical protein HD806DRAFT_533746 [Xylariaceae sp. AK1471]|nr:hypothetical protein HD806DRAFT_533746 [Xylariaceae sp. AK1471]